MAGPTKAAVQAGTEQSLTGVPEARGALLHTLCARAHLVVAVDLAQEVFLATWQARPRFIPERGPLAAPLRGIQNRIIDAYRKGWRRVPEINNADGERVTPIAETRAPVEDIADRSLITEDLSAMAEPPLRIMRLAYFDELPHKQLTEQTAMPLGTVKGNIRKGLARLSTYAGAQA